MREEQVMRLIARAETLHKAALKDLRSEYINTARGRVFDMDLLTLYRHVTAVRDARPIGTRKIYDAGLTLRAIYDVRDGLPHMAAREAVDKSGRIVKRLRELMEDTPEMRMGALLRGA